MKHDDNVVQCSEVWGGGGQEQVSSQTLILALKVCEDGSEVLGSGLPCSHFFQLYSCITVTPSLLNSDDIM